MTGPVRRMVPQAHQLKLATAAIALIVLCITSTARPVRPSKTRAR